MGARAYERGVALITAILIVAIASIAAVALAARQSFDIRRAANMLEADQAYAFVASAEEAAKIVLPKIYNNPGVMQSDLLGRRNGGPLDPDDATSGVIWLELYDLQGRFNLNNLAAAAPDVRAQQVSQLERLLTGASLNPDLAKAVLDWVDGDVSATYPGGAEDSDYLGLAAPALPYRASNGPMGSPSELRLLQGFAEQFEKMAAPDADPDQVAAWNALLGMLGTLPAATPINVNTAPPKVLMTLSDKITDGVAQALARVDDKGVPLQSNNVVLPPWPKKDDFISDVRAQLNIPANDPLELRAFDVVSEYFLLVIEVSFGDTVLHAYSVLEVKNGKVAVVSRGLGSYV